MDRVRRRAAEDGDGEDSTTRLARARKPARLSVPSVVTRDVVAGGRRLETVRYPGDPARATIVLLHEGLGSVAMWKDVPRRLCTLTGCSIVAFSREGYGTSDPLSAPREPEYMHHEARVVLPEVLADLGIERPVVFGHSDGASIALLYAAAYPGAARALVLEAPHVFVEEISVRSIAAAKDAWATTTLRERLARYHADVDGAFRGWNDIWLDPRFRGWNIEDEAATVRVPVLVVQGDADEYGTLAQVESIVRRIPGAEECIVAGAGHSPHRDRADVVLARIASFVERVAR